jgi:hypothetical protein
MKTSKLLIFILSVILLIFVIKCLLGGRRVREGFIDEVALWEDMQEMDAIKSSRQFGAKLNELIDIVNPIRNLGGDLKERMDVVEELASTNNSGLENVKGLMELREMDADVNNEGSLAKQMADMVDVDKEGSLAKQMADMVDVDKEGSLAKQIDELEILIATNTENIATNTENIATNTENIATNTENIATNAADIVKSKEILTAIPDALKDDDQYTPWIGTREEGKKYFNMTIDEIENIFTRSKDKPISESLEKPLEFGAESYKQWYFKLSNITDVLKYYAKQSTLTDYAKQSNLTTLENSFTLNDYAKQSNLTTLEQSFGGHNDNTNVHFEKQDLTHKHASTDLTDWGVYTENHIVIHTGINNSLKNLSNKDHNHASTDLTDWSNHTENHKKIDGKLTKQDGKLAEHGGKLAEWKNIFTNAQAELGFKVKCLKGGEYGLGSENCPTWLKKYNT